MNTMKYAGIKRSNFIDCDGSLKRQKLSIDNNNIASTQLDLHKNNIETNTKNINNDNIFLNNDNSINMISDNEDIESTLSINNSKYEQINSTLRILHNYRKFLKNNFEKDQNNNSINNNIPIYNNFYSKINSQLKTIHISNIKLHKKNYLN
ncbi:hypothetical protein LY90DRAFT_664861 [Neocallimastix californiae]|uniref:Uncharacterized protein n=1 Tax=Neocallimastix californiae TaxID=1754190 RepID=A0A1Y2F8M1_9FUNG|nr:hypothetical protein LY90DRAFT_664861 [Neocallimastix californiae]|eukprot:ORY79255.1 hypothetical protein LY90DRAFT_664861 [Neocallimastix californiae]